ncbi:MAG: mRNA interferase MazF [bacterium]|jgi:mRNA interferase MazF
MSLYPKKGDFVWFDFDPQSGHEQKSRRPALVISEDSFNKKTGFAVVCPITNADPKSRLHLSIEGTRGVSGTILVDQFKSLDFQSRKSQFIEVCPNELVEEVLDLIDPILFGDE